MQRVLLVGCWSPHATAAVIASSRHAVISSQPPMQQLGCVQSDQHAGARPVQYPANSTSSCDAKSSPAMHMQHIAKVHPETVGSTTGKMHPLASSAYGKPPRQSSSSTCVDRITNEMNRPQPLWKPGSLTHIRGIPSSSGRQDEQLEPVDTWRMNGEGIRIPHSGTVLPRELKR